MTVPCRVSVIGAVKVNALSDSSIVQFGDSRNANMSDRAIALQRRFPNFQGDETRFATYPIFSLPLPSMQTPPDAVMVSRNRSDSIQVGNIHLISIRASSYLHAGCLRQLTTESRIMHIRHFNNRLPRSLPGIQQ